MADVDHLAAELFRETLSAIEQGFNIFGVPGAKVILVGQHVSEGTAGLFGSWGQHACQGGFERHRRAGGPRQKIAAIPRRCHNQYPLLNQGDYRISCLLEDRGGGWVVVKIVNASHVVKKPCSGRLADHAIQ